MAPPLERKKRGDMTSLLSTGMGKWGRGLREPLHSAGLHRGARAPDTVRMAPRFASAAGIHLVAARLPG
jgi:hypothetical protein